MPGERTQALMHILEEHFHSEQLVAPSGASPTSLPASGVAWTYGNKQQIIAAGSEPEPFDIHWVSVSALSANADYEIALYAGGPGAEVLIGTTCVTRGGVQVTSFQGNMQTTILAAGTRVSAAVRDSAGTSTAAVKLLYHRY